MNKKEIAAKARKCIEKYGFCQTKMTKDEILRLNNEDWFFMLPGSIREILPSDFFRKNYPNFDPRKIYYTSKVNLYCDFEKLFFEVFDKFEYLGMVEERAKKAEVKSKDFIMFPIKELRIELLGCCALMYPDDKFVYRRALQQMQDIEFGANNISRETFNLLMSKRTAEDSRIRARHLADLPDVVTIYRGVNRDSTPWDKAYIWTISYEVARWFADWMFLEEKDGKCCVITGTIKRDDIEEYFPNKIAQTVFADPRKITFVKKEIVPVRPFEERTALKDFLPPEQLDKIRHMDD